MAGARRFTLHTQLLVSFAGMGLLVAALLAVGSRLVDDAAARLEATLETQVRPLARLSRLQSQVDGVRVLEVEMPRLVDPFAVSDQVELLQSAALAFDTDLRRFATTPGALDPRDAQALLEAWQRYRSDLQRSEQFASAMKLDDVQRVATYDSVQRFKAISRTIKQAAERTEAQADAAFRQALAEHDRLRAWFAGISFGGLALLALWLALLARSVTGRLSRLSAAATDLAEGRGTGPLAVPGHDELADLGRAFDTMLATVAAREAALRAAQEDLERRVAARTDELELANGRLVREIDERRRAETLLQHQAQFDSLTGLPNRVLAMERLNQAMRGAQRNGSLVVLVFLDLDDFKKVNDNLGHAAGDALLVQAAQRLQESVRPEDTVARLGGDEFVIVLTDVAAAEDAQAVTEKLLQAFRPPFLLGGHQVVVSPSMGLAVHPDDGEDTSSLLRHADLAMYEAKESGRNTYRFFNRLAHDRSVRRLMIESRLRQALERQELWLAFQPLVQTRDQRLVGAEALLRWNSPEIGKVPPDQFIAVAEHTGLIVPIGAWVIEQACTQLAAWHRAGRTDLHVSVNVSPRQFRDAQLLGSVREALARHALPAHGLQIEVTEGLLIRNQPEVRATLEALTQMGVRLALDDFGTGYSSLSYLKRYPFDLLKIDREFVRDLAIDPDDRALVSAAISMARGLSLAVVAEGVESEAQLAFLRELQCDFVQGYLFSPPVPATEFHARWLSADAALPAAG
jgi:diguanylate cyclase (GGDEF)-like protein